MRELRHDFRLFYHVCYDDVDTEEAIDLIQTLPQGSRYMAATDFTKSWTERKHMTADVVDALAVVAWALGAYDKSVAEPPRVRRPSDVMRLAKSRDAARTARLRLESDGWEDA